MNPSERAEKRLRAALPNNAGGSSIDVFFDESELAEELSIPRALFNAANVEPAKAALKAHREAQGIFEA